MTTFTLTEVRKYSPCRSGFKQATNYLKEDKTYTFSEALQMGVRADSLVWLAYHKPELHSALVSATERLFGHPCHTLRAAADAVLQLLTVKNSGPERRAKAESHFVNLIKLLGER